MSRGPLPVKAFAAALRAAMARGHVMHFRRTRGSTADLMVSGGGILAIVRVQSAPRIHGTPAEIAAEFHNTIAPLRIHPAGGPVSLELWLCSRYGVLRFFRVLGDGIAEIGADGNVLPAGPMAHARINRSRSCQKKPAAPEKIADGEVPEDPAAGDIPPALPEPPGSEKSPVVPEPGSGEVPAVQATDEKKPVSLAPGGDILMSLKEPVAGEGPGGPG